VDEVRGREGRAEERGQRRGRSDDVAEVIRGT
jgi:hypothetical protein